jgi:hypothetical protein
MSVPTVSVVVPVFRAERFIAATIESVLAQTFRDFEIILVDDGSPDRSAEICARYGDPRIRLLRQANAGVAAARNAGIRRARADIIAFLDSDDIWTPTKLARHVTLLQQRPDVDVSFDRSRFIDETGQELGSLRGSTLPEITPFGILLRDPTGTASAVVARRRALDAIAYTATAQDGSVQPAYFDEEPILCTAEDTDCWFRMAQVGRSSFFHLPEPLTLYRMHRNGVTAAFAKRRASWNRLVEKAKAQAPGLLDGQEARLDAYQLTAMARRALMTGEAQAAGRFLAAALQAYPEIAIEQPAVTALTTFGWMALQMLPSCTHQAVQRAGLRLHRAHQRLALRSDGGSTTCDPRVHGFDWPMRRAA